MRTVALATALVVLAGGSVAVARAHKSVSLDVDGEIVRVSTFAGSVAGLLDEQGIAVGERDVTAPESTASLRSGDDVVVRHASALVVASGDGRETTVWTTALYADEALEALAARSGGDVRIVASRSGARADLPIRLSDGTIDVVADGSTQQVDGGRTLAAVLASLDLSIGEFDRVQVVLSDEGSARATVTVQRVEVTEVAEVVAEPFGTITEKTSELFTGQSRTVVDGVPGERTIVSRLVLVNGAEESRRVISDTVTLDPVTAVVQQGTKARSSGGAIALGDDVWGALARCESGGNPTIVSRNGLYYGLYQFSLATWQGVGGAGLPSEATPAEQTQRAQALQARSGWGQWPACAAKLGLL